MSALVWRATSVALTIADGTDDVAGWRYGDLFIDFRATPHQVLPFCWMVSHVPTGLGFVGLFTDRLGARALVETLWPLSDWSELRGRDMKPPKALLDWLELLPVQWCLGNQTIAPFTTVDHSKGTVQ